MKHWNCEEIMVGEDLRMHKRAFQALKCMLMHVSGLFPPYFNLKNQLFY